MACRLHRLEATHRPHQRPTDAYICPGFPSWYYLAPSHVVEWNELNSARRCFIRQQRPHFYYPDLFVDGTANSNMTAAFAPASKHYERIQDRPKRLFGLQNASPVCIFPECTRPTALGATVNRSGQWKPFLVWLLLGLIGRSVRIS